MLNLDHPGGIDLLISLISPPDGQDLAFSPQIVKIQVPDGFDLDSLPDFPPNGQDSAEICSKCQLQFLMLMALPVIEESSYLDPVLPLLLSALHYKTIFVMS